MERFVVALAVVVLIASCGEDTPSSETTTTMPPATQTTAPVTTAAPTTVPSTTAPPTTTVAPTTTTTPLPEPLEAWGRLDVDSAVFGDVTITDGDAGTDGRFVLVGCERSDSGAYPAWWSDDAGNWQRADGPGDVGCLTQVEATPFGFFATGLGAQNQFQSTDGVTWELLELADDFGFEEPGQLGVVFAIFVSPAGDRVTLLYSRAAEAESRIATLVTTTDGETWSLGPADSAALFDSSDVSAVIPGGPGLIAVGASPGGEFVPTAAVFTSMDGLNWARATPSNADYDDKIMTDVMAIGTGFVAVGGDFFKTGLMTAWTSPDGVVWNRSPHPPEETDPAVAQMTAQTVTIAGGSIWAAGRDFDARRADDGLPALWESPDGVNWVRADFDAMAARVPFEVIDTPDLRIGVWPPPLSLSSDPVLVFAAD